MNSNHPIPSSWPQEWATEYTATLKKTQTPLGRSHLLNAAIRHIEYCAATGQIFLSCDAILTHRDVMRHELSWSVANSYANKLVLVAQKRDDKKLRDDLLEGFRDVRSANEILMARHVPPRVRILGQRALQCGEITRKDVKALDHYLRVVDRFGALPARETDIRSAFWRHSPGEKYCCEVLGRAAAMIEMFFPGSPEANTLRKAIRSLRPTRRPVARSSRPINETITSLVEAKRQRKRGSKGRPYSGAKKEDQRGVLSRFEKVLEIEGYSFSLDRNAINIFAQTAHKKFMNGRSGKSQLQRPKDDNLLKENQSWSAIYIARTFETLADFVQDQQLRADLLIDANAYHQEAKKEPKKKERRLSEQPTSLPELFSKAVQLVRDSEDVSVKTRTRLLNAAGIVALLCSYPLRRSDLVRLRYGHELVRLLGGWGLTSLDTEKTGDHVEPLRLPSEVTPILDATLLQGASASFLWQAYSEHCGRSIWADWKTGRLLSKELMTSSLKELVGYSPHIFRTVWTDHLIKNGADRTTISIVLQHKTLISQKDYEVLASKLRLLQGVEALAEIINN